MEDIHFSCDSFVITAIVMLWSGHSLLIDLIFTGNILNIPIFENKQPKMSKTMLSDEDKSRLKSPCFMEFVLKIVSLESSCP